MPAATAFTPVDVTLRNYRAFDDRTPARFRLGAGMTAFVGPNNAGKSTLLRFVHELRRHFRDWGAARDVDGILGGEAAAAWQLLDVGDPDEIACVRNDRPVEVQFDWATSEPPGEGEAGDTGMLPLRRVVVRGERTTRCWSAEAFAGRAGRELLPVTRFAGTVPPDRFRAGRSPIADLAPWRQLCTALGESLYVGPYRNVVTTGDAAYYDLAIGTAFVTEWNDWKTGPARARAQTAQRVTRDVRRIFGYDHLEINASRDRRELQVVADGHTFQLREHGAGLAQFVFVLAAAAMRAPTFVLIDEPELHLHASLQAEFLRALASYARLGTVFATHSLGLARTMAERVYVVRREGGRPHVRPFGGTPHYAELLGELGFGGYQVLGGERVLLVEGFTDVKAVQEVLRAYGKEGTTIVVPLGGTQLIAADRDLELAELRRLAPHAAVLIDSERGAADAPLPPQRAAFVATCARLGFRVHATERRALDNYYTDAAVRAVRGGDAAALGPYVLLKDAPKPWGKHDNWRIAREMTRADWEQTDVGTFVAAL